MPDGVVDRHGRRKNPVHLATLNGSPTLGRFAFVNHFMRAVSALAPTSNFPKLSAFLPQNLFPWIWNYLKFAFTRRYPFPDYTGTGKSGVYKVAGAPTGKPVIGVPYGLVVVELVAV